MRLPAAALTMCFLLSGCASQKDAAMVVGVTGLAGALTTGAAITGACAGGCGPSAVPWAALGGGASLVLIGAAYAMSRPPAGATPRPPSTAPTPHPREDVPIF